MYLKPCPFCGSEKGVQLGSRAPIKGTENITHFVSCSKCGATISSDDSLANAYRVMELWNARAFEKEKKS
jgi:Lar family restriction alleviation protein